MADLTSREKVKRVQLEAVVIRADGSRDDLGVISDSRWYWRCGPSKWLAARRTQRANRRLNDGES